MATLYDIAGTTQQYFTIGGTNGVTTYLGNIIPDSSIGKPGDRYIQVKTEIEGFVTVSNLTELNNYNTSNLYDGYYIRVANDSNHQFHTTTYVWNNSITNWDFVFDEDSEDYKTLYRDYGKVYTKTIKRGTPEWEQENSFEFDNPIITTTYIEPGLNRISIQPATNDAYNYPTNNIIDYNTNHDSYGVTRFATDYEMTTHSNNLLVTVTPSQVFNVVNAVETNLQNQINVIKASSDVFDIVNTYADLMNYNITGSNITNNDIVKVLHDETENNATAYYRYNETTNSFGNSIGTLGPYYMTNEADALFVHKEGNNELINGSKIFTNGLKSSETISNTSNDTTVPTTAWVKDVVSGYVTLNTTQTISGNKTFTGDVSFGANTVGVTANYGDSTNTIATTAFVQNAIAGSGYLPPTIGNNGNYLTVVNNAATWLPLEVTLNGLSDVTINSQTDGQTIVFNATNNTWENGNPTVATIRYW